MCEYCNVEKDMIHTEGSFVCPLCGDTEYMAIDCEIQTNKESICEKAKAPYKKLNHFKERMNQFQSKESINIPEEVYNIIRAELTQKKIPLKSLTFERVKRILKKYKLNKYYEHVYSITSKITGIHPPLLTKEIEDEMCRRFMIVEELFEIFKPRGRTNFLNYSFLINKLFLSLNLPNYAAHFGFLKSKEKQQLHEKLWSKISTAAGWNIKDNICKPSSI